MTDRGRRRPGSVMMGGLRADGGIIQEGELMKTRSLRGYALSTVCALALALVISGNLGAQRGNVDWAAVGLSTHHVAGTFHYLEGQGGNIGLSICEDGVVMIDDQFGPLSDRIRATINGISNGNIRFLINTHVHGDHTGGTRTSPPWVFRSWHRTACVCVSPRLNPRPRCQC